MKYWFWPKATRHGALVLTSRMFPPTSSGLDYLCPDTTAYTFRLEFLYLYL